VVSVGAIRHVVYDVEGCKGSAEGISMGVQLKAIDKQAVLAVGALERDI